MAEERVSDLTGIGELFGRHPSLPMWPPEPLAPGVVLRRRRQVVRDPKTQEVKETKTYIVTYVEDPQAYYNHLHLRNYRPEDDRNCRACNGAGFLRYERPVGHPLFGKYIRCERCTGEPEPWQGKAAPWAR